MPNNQNAKVGKQYTSFTSEIKSVAVQMASQDISNWKAAINAFRNATNPKRRLLYSLYENLKLDGHFISVSGKRKTNITNKRIMFEPGKDVKTIDEKINDLILETPWFYDLRGHACDAKTWSHSLIELIPSTLPDQLFDRVELIPRMNVKPETGFVALDASNDTKGIYYKGENADPTFAPYLIEVGKPKDEGLLMSAAQYIIYKRGGFGDWSQFGEIFGMPFRVGKYSPFDDSGRQKLDKALSEMGGAGHVVIPEGTDLVFHNPVQSGQSDIYKDIIELCNQEMSKIYLGQTMTTDNGSSKSQGNIHKEVEEDINLSDMIEMEYLLNWDFKNKVYNITGLADLQKGKFRFPEIINIPLDKRFEMDIALSEKIPMTEEYFYRTYGISKPGDGEKVILKSAIDNPGGPQKKKLQLKNRQLTALYKNSCKKCLSEFITLVNESDFEKEALRLAKEIHARGKKTGFIDPDLLQQTADALMQAVSKGLAEVSEEDLIKAEAEILKSFTENVYVFSAAKTYEELKQASALLFDENNNVRSFADFKNDFFELHKVYNIQHLAAEYNHAVASAQMGAKWLGLDLTGNGKYSTVGDELVRDEHKAFDGIIAPWKSEFWLIYYPPNGWGCRCDADDAPPKSTITDLKGLSLPAVPKMFQGNPGVDGVIFPETHPYFEQSAAALKIINKAADKANGQ